MTTLNMEITDTITHTIGELQLLQIYIWYDRPLLFSCQSADGQRYLAVISRDDGGFEEWVYSPIAAELLDAVNSGSVDLYTAFKACPLAWVFANTGSALSVQVKGADLRDDQLPLAGEIALKTTIVAPPPPYLAASRAALDGGE